MTTRRSDETLADRLRKAERKDADKLLEMLSSGDLAQLADRCAEVPEAVEAVDLLALEALSKAVAGVPGVSHLAGRLQSVAEAVVDVVEAVGGTGRFEEFDDNCQAAQTALAEWIRLRDAEDYYGTREMGRARDEAWEEAVAALDRLADSWEKLDEKF